MTKASQDWVGENVMGKTKSPTSDERGEDHGLINGDTAHPIRQVFRGEGNGPVTVGCCAYPLCFNLNPTFLSFFFFASHSSNLFILLKFSQ